MGRVLWGFFALFSIFQTLTGHTPPTRHILRICPSHPTPHADTMASGGGDSRGTFIFSKEQLDTLIALVPEDKKDVVKDIVEASG